MMGEQLFLLLVIFGIVMLASGCFYMVLGRHGLPFNRYCCLMFSGSRFYMSRVLLVRCSQSC